MEFAELIKTPKLDNVALQLPLLPACDGTLCITGHHLILSSRKDNKEELWLLHRDIDSVEKKPGVQGGGTIVIKCKDFRIVQLTIPTTEEFHNIANSIEWLSNIEDITLMYPFFYRPMFDILEDGWTAFLLEAEFSKLTALSDDWKISYVNKTYSVCPTYPHAVVVPKCVDDATLQAVANFRQGGRFPVLSYFHKENKAVLLRSSQPMVGPNNRRCREDERLLNAVLTVGNKGYIVDTRAQALAHMAKTKGGGFEPEGHYPQWKRMPKAIERHQNLLESLSKLVEACNDSGCSMDKWLSRLDSSGWMTHIKDILNCACLVAQCIDHEGCSVLVHGSEGMDTTLLVTSLTQVILDPDCRTVSGFEALVEREWIQAGHPFTQRCQRSAYTPASSRTKHNAPTFLLFLDCVWQIYQQFPCSFEFNEDFLVMLFEHTYSSQFGTFLCNSECERKELKLSEKSVSLWSYINRPEVLQSYLNCMYEPNNKIIWPSVAPMSLNLWSGLYLRWVVDQVPVQRTWKTIKEIKEKDKDLRSKAQRLRRQLIELEKEAVTAGLVTPPSVDCELGLDGL